MTSFNPLLNHAVKKSINDLLAIENHDQFLETNSSIDDSHRWHLSRVFSIAHDAELAIGKLDPEDANLAALDGLSNALTKSLNELNNFIANSSTGHIVNARNQMESNALVHLRRLLPIGFKVHPRTETALEGYKTKFLDAKKRQDRTIKELRGQLSTLQSNLTEETTKLSSLAAEVSNQRSESETLMSDLRSADIARVEENNRQSKESLIAAEQRLNKFVESKEKSFLESLASIRKAGRDVIQEIEIKRDEASGIVQSVGDLLTTGTYADRANTENRKADTFRAITVGLFAFGLLIIVSNYIFYGIAATLGREAQLAESWQSLAARLATGLAVALPAFYTARESARHRTNADTAKQRELELTTLGPFIELLPDGQKTAIRDRLTDRYFGGEVEPHDVKPPVDVDALAKALLEVAKKNDVE